jgi:hypothetical protein
VTAIVAALVVSSLVTARFLARRPSVDVPTWRLAWRPPDPLSLGAGPDHPFGLALAPDGRRVVFPAAERGLSQLWMRDLSTGDTQPLAGTDEATLPFWSPDGRAVGFFARGRLLAYAFENASVANLAEAPSPHGGVWHASGDIVFAPGDSGLMRRRGDGTVELATALDAASGESSHRYPALTADASHMLFYVVAAEPIRQGIWIAPVDRPENRVRLATSNGHALAGEASMPGAGVIMYANGDALVAQSLDVARLQLVGPQTLLATSVGIGPAHQLLATVQRDVLMYGRAPAGLRLLQWLDRSGAPVGTIGEPMHAWDVRIDPSTSRVAVARVDPQLGTLDVFVYEGDRPLPLRVSPAIDADETPVWSRDGASLSWSSARRSVTRRRANADRPDELVRKLEHPVRITDWSPDGRWIVVSETRPGTRADVWLLPADTGEARAYAQSPFNEIDAAVSADGRWIAYASDESGRFEIYVDRFPDPGARARVSSGGGVEPRWNADGTELYFRRGNAIHAVQLSLADGAVAAASEQLFTASGEMRAYDVTPDGRRFLVNLPAAESERPDVSVVVNWRQLLPKPQ